MDENASPIARAIAPAAAPEIVVAEAGKLAQNLRWDNRDESLWWTDLEGGRLFRFNLETRIPSVIYEGPPVGAFIQREDGRWLLFREKDIALLDFDRHDQVVPLIENVRIDGDRFNEAVADAEGRVLVGTVRARRPNGAGLYRLDPTGGLVKILGGTGHSSGMGFNGKGDVLYWICGTTRTIFRCRYDGRRGVLTNRQAFHECQPDEGMPAGLALDSEETIWSARREAGAILKIAATRALVGQISFPARHVTSLAFGGADLRTVFVSVISEEGQSKIYAFQSALPGIPVRRAGNGRSAA